MAADLFETYAVTAVAVMLLGVLTFGGDQQTAVILFPLVLGGVSIVASIIGTFAVKSAAGNVERALYQGLILSGALAALLILPVTAWMMDDLSFSSAAGGEAPGWFDIYVCALIGLAVTASRRSSRPRRRRSPATRRTSSRASRRACRRRRCPPS
jgi:K(+)-stimulated pyrophosphate-energized sodium pump